MRTYSEYIDLSYTMFHESARRGLMFHQAEDEALNGRTITVGGQNWINFGSCSYLGLEVDERLKTGVTEAVSRYGTQFSSSRAMVSAPPYQELEHSLELIFGHPPLLAPNTSLGHIATLPIAVQERDLMILDQQVHMSVLTGAKLARDNGAKLEIIRHSDLAQLEAVIQRERSRHRHIWYLADGLYSMYGDFAPLDGLLDLMARYEQLHLYVDDAHAMSWCGQYGRGYILGNTDLHARMIVATSLNKAFACAGGALLIPDASLRAKLRTVGGPLIYSGPIQPPMLGAALASARLHLSEDFPGIQVELLQRIQFCNRVFNERGLPLISQSESPVRFVATGLPRVSYNMVDRLQKEGFYLNVAVFPVVPMKRAGLRFTLTRHHTLADIENLAQAIAHHLPLALAEEGSTIEAVRASFGLSEAVHHHPPVSAPPGLQLEKHGQIAELDPGEWDALLGDRGTFSHAGLALLERSFTGHQRPEDNWRFLYYVVRDAAGRPILATFFTDTIWKDDMIASAEVSRQVEQRRTDDPYFLTSRTLAMGAPLTEGDHLYLDRSADWQGALRLVLQDLATEQHGSTAQAILLRDLNSEDTAMAAFLLEQGFARSPMPETMVLTLVPGEPLGDYLARLTRRSRRFLRSEVLPGAEAVIVSRVDAGKQVLSGKQLAHLHQLYRNVQARSLELNTFPLPIKVFEQISQTPNWEFLLLSVPEAVGNPHNGHPVAFVAAYRGKDHYVPLVAGMDYGFVASHGVYRQALWASVQRARELGVSRVCFGFGAKLEKHRFGGQEAHHVVFSQASDTYHFEFLLNMMGRGERASAGIPDHARVDLSEAPTNK